MPQEKEAVKTEGTEPNGTAPASATGDNKGTEQNQNTSSPDAKGSSSDAGQGKEGYVPKSRLDEVIAQRNIERREREELERKLREAEQFRSTPTENVQQQNGSDDIFTNPEGFISKRFNPRINAVEHQLESIAAQNMELAIRNDYEANPAMQKLYGDYNELSYAIDNYAKQIGFNKKLSPSERRLVYSNLIDARKGDIIKVAMEMGRDEEKKRREIIPTTSDVAGSNVIPVKGKDISLSSEEMAFMAKIGLTKEALKEHMEKSQSTGGKITSFHPDL